MIDYFALLQQRRRPWLDPGAVKSKYRELARDAHPDQHPTNQRDETKLATLNEAYRVLVDPKLRLHHLLRLEGAPPSSSTDQIPEDLADLFMIIAPALKEIEPETNQIDDLIRRVRELSDRTLEELREVDAKWNEKTPLLVSRIEQLYHRISYLTRWLDLLEERRFQLSI
jgi:curved DNA-binding protein CbpA